MDWIGACAVRFFGSITTKSERFLSVCLDTFSDGAEFSEHWYQKNDGLVFHLLNTWILFSS